MNAETRAGKVGTCSLEKTMERFAVDLGDLFSSCCRAIDPDTIQSLLCGFSESAACRSCPYSRKGEMRTHQYGYQEAGRWGGSYIYYCPKGLTFCAFVADTDRTGGVIFGPVVLGEPQDLLLDAEGPAFRAGVEQLRCFSPERLGSLNEVGAVAVRGVAAGHHGSTTYDQAEFLNELYLIREQYPHVDEDYSYIPRAEEEMKILVRNMDKPGVQKLLNELLGRIYLQSYYNLDEVKTRCVELIVVLSRTVVDAGVEMGRIFHFSTEFLRRISSFQSIDALCAWMSDILHGFMDAMFSFAGIKHADAVYKTMNYIRSNWRDKPSLDEIARHAYLSKSYLSMLFKQETGIGISEFTNQVRIEHSKKLLTTTDLSIAAIASECCFHDQSYYTKVFQKMVGVSPKKYRDRHAVTAN